MMTRKAGGFTFFACVLPSVSARMDLPPNLCGQTTASSRKPRLRNLLNDSNGASLGMNFFDLPPIIERMLLVSDKISDLNFSVGQLPQVEINGKLTPVQPLGLQKLS